MELQINGSVKIVDDGITVSELVSSFGLAPAQILVEISGEALLRSEWSERKLTPQDKVELIRVVAGG